MTAIKTTYQGPTNTRSARIRAAWTEPRMGPAVYVRWQRGESLEANHARALRRLLAANCAARWAVPGEWHAGEVRNGYVWVWADPLNVRTAVQAGAE